MIFACCEDWEAAGHIKAVEHLVLSQLADAVAALPQSNAAQFVPPYTSCYISKGRSH